ncbi:MAG: SLC13 family permease [Schleiferiaceae bacterium]|nr:SLC13 family permease [Schleiferiaceae bacterium]
MKILKSKTLYLVTGPILFFAALLFSDRLGWTRPEATVAGSTAWMLLWWFTEVIPLAATALLPMVTFGGMGVLSSSELANAYSHPLIFLFLAGFFLARGVEHHQLHRRFALAILRRFGSQSQRVLAGVMLATFLLSLWMSNTATAVMMLPLTLSLIRHLPSKDELLERNILLGMAWGANLGGLGTLIGTPPNLVYAAFRQQALSQEVNFLDWSLQIVPIALVLLVLAFFLLRRNLPKADLREVQWPEAAEWTSGEKRVALIFATTALAWMTRPWLQGMAPSLALTDTWVGLTGALLLFILRDAERKPLLRWEDAQKIEWGILLLFGGGMSLAAGMQSSGWLEALAESGIQGWPPSLWILAFTLLGVWTTELFSNMALVSATLPIALAISIAQGMPFELLAVPLTVGASCAFMLPMATPPNAIVFASGKIRIADMARSGFWMNVLATLVIWLYCSFVL